MQCDTLQPIEFEECLLQCITIYPAITDGGNTVGTLQALELPYYDPRFGRAFQNSKVAFLNEGSIKMELFRKLSSCEKNEAEFRWVEQTTQACYAEGPQARERDRDNRPLPCGTRHSKDE